VAGSVSLYAIGGVFDGDSKFLLQAADTTNTIQKFVDDTIFAFADTAGSGIISAVNTLAEVGQRHKPVSDAAPNGAVTEAVESQAAGTGATALIDGATVTLAAT